MIFNKKPFKLTYKGRFIPGFILKLNTDTSIKIDESKKIDVKNELLPNIKDSIDTVIDELKDI